jgi:hypothetical protein
VPPANEGKTSTAYAEGMVGGGWLWVCLIDPLAPDIPILIFRSFDT